LKVATVIGSAIGVALYSINPNIVIALIVSAPGIITAFLAILSRRDAKRAELARSLDHAVTMGVMKTVAAQTDGINTKLFAEKTKLEGDNAIQATQLTETAQKLAHVEGHEEGRQAGVASEIDREPPKQ
jgi:hypothetical protein